jgi:cytochrome P450
MTPSISTKAFWSKPAEERAVTFAELRRSAPVSRQEPPDFGLAPQTRPFWAVARYEDVVHVSRTPDVFCSGAGVGLGNQPRRLMELNASFLVMDPPRHTELRRVVSSAFTPRRIAQLDHEISAEATRIVDELVERGGGDVARDLASKLPLWSISQMMGVPESVRSELQHAAERQLAAQDPEFGEDSGAVAVRASETMHRIATDLIALRRSSPGDDVLSTLVHAEFEGAALSDELLGGIFVLMTSAGNDTTRTATSHGVRLFSEHPQQWERLVADRSLLPTAVEEVIRCASPVIEFRRTATRDTQLADVSIAEGDAVVMLYESANRDEAVFDCPQRFDIGRDPNPHLGFGGGGSHFCLGANLARAQLRALFGRLSERVATITAGEPDRLVSYFVNGIKRMPVVVTPRAPAPSG